MIDETEVQSKNEAILDLLSEPEHRAGLSTHRIVKLLRERGVTITSTGQALGRLRVLQDRKRVERVAGERPGWTLWKVVE